MLVRRIDTDTSFAARDAKETTVVHRFQQMRRRARSAAPVVPHRSVRELRVHFARVHGAALAHERQHRLGMRAACFGPRFHSAPRVHQRLYGPRKEAVVEKVVFLDRQRRIQAFQVAGAVVAHAMAQGEILRARRCANGIGLHEAEPVQRSLKCGGREKAARDGEATQIVERGDWILFEPWHYDRMPVMRT